jgi:hypothetical protein
MHDFRLSRRSLLAGAPLAAAAAAPAAALPSVPLGKTRVSRLIAGANPINGFAHSTERLSQLMVQYFTVERTAQFLLDCERHGITTWQTSWQPKIRQALPLARERGSKIQFLVLSRPTEAGDLKAMQDMGAIAVVHHGSATDSAFHAGQVEEVRDFVKRVKDLGLTAGVSSHNPDNIARIEDSGWENDFYMTCLYNVTRTPEEIRKMTGDSVLGELFLAGDPQRMLARVREVKKTCLVFKLLAAGRVSGTPAGVEKAFAFAYKNMKPGDAAIVGMYPVLNDEIAEDAALARKYA